MLYTNRQGLISGPEPTSTHRAWWRSGQATGWLRAALRKEQAEVAADTAAGTMIDALSRVPEHRLRAVLGTATSVREALGELGQRPTGTGYLWVEVQCHRLGLDIPTANPGREAHAGRGRN